MIEFYPPVSTGEWVQAAGAAFTIFIGLILLVMPGLALRFSGHRSESEDKSAKIVARAHLSGLYLGLGLAVLLLQQPLLYLALGISWGFSALGQIISIIIDRAISVSGFIVLIVKSSVSAVLILAVLGYFG